MATLKGFYGQDIHIPEDRFYYAAKEFWVKPAEDGRRLYFGPTHAGIIFVSGVTMVEYVVDVGERVEEDDNVAFFETYKAIVNITTPVAGVVADLNQDLRRDPTVLDEHYYETWVFAIEPDQPVDCATTFLDAEGYMAALLRMESDHCGAGARLARQARKAAEAAESVPAAPAETPRGERVPVIVVGGGPGGFAAARRAAELGAAVTLVERAEVGGECLHWACIPTKTLLESASRLEDLRVLAEFGLSAQGVAFDLEAIQERREAVVAELAGRARRLLIDSGVRLITAQASLTEDGAVRVERADGGQEEIAADKIILATGSSPATVPGLESALTSRDVLALRKVPPSLLIIGGGRVGLELATLFASLGSQVTIVEMLPRLLPAADAEVSQHVERLLTKRGIAVFTESQVEGISGNFVTLRSKGARRTVQAAQVLVAVGRVPNTQGLGLERLGVRMNEAAIAVTKRMETSQPGLYAVGDVTGRHYLAYVAAAEGEVAAENALGGRATMDYTAVPRCVYTRPQVASVGLTEEQAREQESDVVVSRASWGASDRAFILGQTEGLIKVVASPDRLLGVHIVGPHATDLIMEGALALKLGLGLEALASLIYPHPTLGEALREAVRAAQAQCL
jgi:dihydrolipoamide dehydrogenase